MVTPHSWAAKAWHWGFIVLFLYALAKQIDEVEELEDAALLQSEMILAVVFLVVLVARFLFMHFTRPTALPEDTPARLRTAARVAHVGMYVSMALIAITGLAIGGLYGADIKSGLALEAALLGHEVAVIATYWLIALHIAGAVYHRSLGDGIWNSMVPLWKERSSD